MLKKLLPPLERPPPTRLKRSLFVTPFSGLSYLDIGAQWHQCYWRRVGLYDCQGPDFHKQYVAFSMSINAAILV